MGEVWKSCDDCGDAFSDYSDYGYCAGCETSYCGSCHNKHVEKYGSPKEESEAYEYFGGNASNSCTFCSGDKVKDEDLLNFALELLGFDYNELAEKYKIQMKGI